MKSILKNIDPKLDLDYNKTFTSERIVKELRKDGSEISPFGWPTNKFTNPAEPNEKLRKTESSARINAGCMRIVEYKM